MPESSAHPSQPASGATTVSLSDALKEAADPAVILGRIVEQALVLLPPAEGAVVELASQGHMNYVCAAGSLSPHVGTHVPLAGTLSGLAVDTGQTMRCDDSAVDDRVNRELCGRLGTTSMVCVPLERDSRALGVLKVTSSQRGAFAEADVTTLTRLSEFVTNAVSTATETSRSIAELLSGQEPAGAAGQGDPIAEFIANVMHPGLVEHTEGRRRVRAALEARAFDIVVQPVFDLTTGRVLALEALSRFHSLPYRPPDLWFSEAHRAGLGAELELAAAEAALGLAGRLNGGVPLAVNVGPGTIASDRLVAMVEAAGPANVVLELTEHLRVEDYPALNRRLEPLRQRGTKLAVDDTGAGTSSLNHILKLAPDIIKLDRYLTSGVDIDPVRRALASALVTFAGESGAVIVAEGIETRDELDALRSLGVRYGQGFHLARPCPFGDLDMTAGSGRH